MSCGAGCGYGAPEASLRQAQLWLRRLSSSEIDAYVAGRAHLRHRYVSRGGRRAFNGGMGDSTPLSAIEFWGGFIFSGA